MKTEKGLDIVCLELVLSIPSQHKDVEVSRRAHESEASMREEDPRRR